MNEKIKEIIEKISYYDGTFPKEELQTLLDNREESTPFLLDAIRNPEEVLDKLLKFSELTSTIFTYISRNLWHIYTVILQHFQDFYFISRPVRC